MLLHFEGKEEAVSFGKFCALAFMKEYKNPDSYYEMPRAICGSCDLDIQDRNRAVQLHNCNHHVHKTCLEECLEFPKTDQDDFQNKCQVCQKHVLLGLDQALKVPKMKPNKVSTKVKRVSKEKVEEVVEEMQLKTQPISFGVSGTGLVGAHDA